MFLQIDTFVFDRIEQFSHWWQRLTGRTNFWWASGACMAASLFIIYGALELVGSPNMVGAFDDAFNKFVIVLFGVSPLIRTHQYRKLDRYYERSRQFAHPLTLKFRDAITGRYFLIGAIVLMSLGRCLGSAVPGGSASLAGAWSYLLGLYFEMVIPLPPGRSRLQEWYQSRKASRQLATAPS